MYNKLFTKIVTSSIWLEDNPTRIVWMMFIALMDEDGFVEIASVRNVASTARVKESEAARAIKCLESPDPDSSNQKNEGRRIERVPGGWMVLNSGDYRAIIKRETVKEQTRIRVARYRASKSNNVTQCNADVTECNGSVTAGNEKVTPSEAVSEARSEAEAPHHLPEEPPTPRLSPGVKEGKNSKSLPTTEQSKRIATIFHRRLTTPWQPNEVAAYKKIGIIPTEDLLAVERYYSENWPPDRNKNILRHDLITFLNNIQGEIDRAHAALFRPASIHKSGIREEIKCPIWDPMKDES